MFENGVLEKIFGPMKQKRLRENCTVAGKNIWTFVTEEITRKLHGCWEEYLDLCNRRDYEKTARLLGRIFGPMKLKR
jgi:hypothetical protein